MAECPLSDPNLGIVTDVEHRAGACLCPLCTCGEHICPGKRSVSGHMGFRTSYSLAFMPPKIESVGKRRGAAQTYHPAPWKMERQSSMQRDYPPHPCSDQQHHEVRSLSPSLKTTVSVSSTHKDYPNWGPPGAAPSKHMPCKPIRLGELRFHGQSSYDLHYCTRSNSVLPTRRTVSRPNSSFRLSGGPGSFQTTNRRAYEARSGWAPNVRERGPVNSYLPTTVAPTSLNVSTMKADYKTPVRVDPAAQLRRKLKHRLLL